MLEIVWTEEALVHLEAISSYIRPFDPAAAEQLADRLVALADSLADFPNRGREAVGGTRELSVVWPYIMRYRVNENTVFITRVRHGARDEED